MLTQYFRAAMGRARYEKLDGEEGYYGEIPECPGAWANAAKLEDCRDELAEVLEEWVLFRVSRNLPLPVIDGVEVTIREVA
ncbi:MAG: type II toxin-antitoxin system HicB family antitoxin [Acidobacteria bacterium]|nr:type II toxin-antitoxin system HicB family antitoxin [Acidobacteriota bacterium]